ncbi:hypothetical protein [Candidatus Nitrospira salsa]
MTTCRKEVKVRETIRAIGHPTFCQLRALARAGLGRVLENILSARTFDGDETQSVRYTQQRLKRFGGFAR